MRENLHHDLALSRSRGGNGEWGGHEDREDTRIVDISGRVQGVYEYITGDSKDKIYRCVRSSLGSDRRMAWLEWSIDYCEERRREVEA